MEIHIEGLDSVRDMLNERAEQIAANIAKGVAEAGELVKGEAKHLAPVSTEKTRPGGPHGELRDSITSVASGNTALIGTNKEYGIYQEFGTYKMAAQPYLVPALKNKENEVRETIKNAVMK